VNQFDIHKIIIGHDHRFGRDRNGKHWRPPLVLGNDMGLSHDICNIEITDFSSSTKIRKGFH
jgi:FAD synthase